MSSPSERGYAFDSPENKVGTPLYQGNDNFLPLGFSTPQHRNSGQSSQNRNYYSAQPKYMLPRTRGGFQNRNRNQYHQQRQQDNSGGGGRGGGTPPAEVDSEERSAEKRNYQKRDRVGQNFKQSYHNRPYHNQQRRNRFGFGHGHNKNSSGEYNINDYYHPSMLEDPWSQLRQHNQRDRTVEGESSDTGEGRQSGSDGDD